MRKVSEVLREERIRQGFSLSDIQKATKIKRQFLEKIEDGKFSDLPSESYALGFVKSFAKFLGLPLNKITAYFRREFEGEAREVIPKYRAEQGRFRKNKLFNHRIVLAVATVLVIGVYLFFQYSSFFFGPDLEVQEPQDGQIFTKNVVSVNGITDPYATVLVDNEAVYVDLSGEFKKTMYVFTGKKVIEIVAKNRFGKETKKEVTIEVK